MNNLKLKLNGTKKLYPTILIDGKTARFKKNEFGNYICNYQTDKNKVEVEVVRYLELGGRFWFPIAILFFIISLFGILQPRYDRTCISIKSKFVIDLDKNTDVTLKLNNVTGETGKAIEVKTESKFEEIVNEYYVDKKVKKRRKILIASEIAIFVATIITVLLIVLRSKV